MRVYFSSTNSQPNVKFSHLNNTLMCFQTSQQIGHCYGSRFGNENIFQYLEYNDVPVLQYNVHVGNSSKPMSFTHPPTPPPSPPPADIQSHFLEWGFGALFLALIGMYALMRSCSNGRAKRVFKTTASKTLGETRQPRFT